MLISVIVPTLDGRVPKSLERTCAGHDEVEIVVVRGVSPVGRARNVGLRRATGEWIAWVDSDDEVEVNWLTEIESAIGLGGGLDAVIFDAKSEGRPWMADLVYGRDATADLVRDVYGDARVQSHLWRTVTRRTLWTGLSFDEQLTVLEDFLLLPRVLLRARRTDYIPTTLYRYIYNRQSSIERVDRHAVADAIAAELRRAWEAPGEFRQEALEGSAKGIYDALLKLNVNPSYRTDPACALSCEGERFLRRNCLRVRVGLHVRLRYVCAGFGFWSLQRLAHWYHFERRGVR